MGEYTRFGYKLTQTGQQTQDLLDTINNKVDKIEGKGLSSEDYTAEEKAKVATCIDNTVNNLVNYYLKTETYTRAEVEALITAINQFSYVVAPTLPTASASTMYKIFLIPSSSATTGNVKDEYITIRSGVEGAYTYTWEQIGSSAIDLSGYATIDALNQAIGSLATVASTGSYNDLTDQPYIPSAMSLLTLNGSMGLLTPGELQLAETDYCIIFHDSDYYHKISQTTSTIQFGRATPDTGPRYITDYLCTISRSSGSYEFTVRSDDRPRVAANVSIGSEYHPDLTTLRVSDTTYKVPDQRQSDWAQNDTTKLDYVKNRTHHIEWSRAVYVDVTNTGNPDGTLANMTFDVKATPTVYFDYIGDVEGKKTYRRPRVKVGNIISYLQVEIYESGSSIVATLYFSGNSVGTNTLSGTLDTGFSLSGLGDEVLVEEYYKLNNKFLDLDEVPTSGSAKPVTSGGVYTAVSAKYTKPATGIPKSDLASAVQTSLGKADTALQSQTQTDWSQNDSLQVDYIKNRTHYDNSIISHTLFIKNVDGNKEHYEIRLDSSSGPLFTFNTTDSYCSRYILNCVYYESPTMYYSGEAEVLISINSNYIYLNFENAGGTLTALIYDGSHQIPVGDSISIVFSQLESLEVDSVVKLDNKYLNLDSSPTANSGNPVTSGGVATAISGFITKSVNDLVNYYLKSETYTKTEVNNLIGAIDQFHYEIYASLAAITDPAGNVLYLIGPTGSGADKYEEYVYANSQFVKIGDTSIDLSGYLPKAGGQMNYNASINISSDLITDTQSEYCGRGYFVHENGTGSAYYGANKVQYGSGSGENFSVSKTFTWPTWKSGIIALDSDLAAKQDTLVSGTNIKTVNGNSLLGSGNLSIDTSHLTEITWSDLKDLRDGGNLVPGCWYRITDYVTTTSQEDTQSAGHQFDVVVLALSNNTLSEEARAIQHSGDTYFANSNLNAWKIWYCLDNDTTRFAWAWNYVSNTTHQKMMIVDDEVAGTYIYTRYPNLDSNGQLAWCYDGGAGDDITFQEYVDNGNELLNESDVIYTTTEYPQIGDILDMSGTDVRLISTSWGQGVIYRMIDEWNNDCPYDFKNILFKRKISLDDGFPNLDTASGTNTWVFTFAATSYNIENDEWSGLKDGSLEPPYGHESDEGSGTYHDNIIGKYIMIYDNEDEDYRKCGKQYLNDSVFLGYWEELGSDDPDNYPFYYAWCSFGCNLGANCHSNTFGYGCCKNIFGHDCNSNIFKNGCHNNILGDNCSSNTFGGNSRYNTLGRYCSSNTFGSTFEYNTLGYFCFSNTFGGFCCYNTFGNICTNNTFGERCNYNTFGNGCRYIKFGNSSTTRGYYENIIVDNGNRNIYLYCSNTTSSSYKYQNVHIGLGVNNTNTYKTITDANRNQTYQTEYLPKNSQTISV